MTERAPKRRIVFSHRRKSLFAGIDEFSKIIELRGIRGIRGLNTKAEA
jgi:hypothetical protein